MRAAPFTELEHRSADRDRIEDIVREPRAHCDMPSAPVLGDILTEERALEVLFDRDAEHLRDTDRDVDAAGEIRVELECIEHHDEEDIRSLKVLRRADHGIDRRKDPVCDHEFFEVAPDHSLKSPLDHTALKGMRGEEFF